MALFGFIGRIKEENYRRFVCEIIESDLWPENGIIRDFM